MNRNFIYLLLICTAVATAAAPPPTDSEKALAARIAASASPAETAMTSRDAWSPGLTAALISLGVARENSNESSAETLYRLSEDMAARTGDAVGEGRAMWELGALLTRESAYPEATDLLRKALAIQIRARKTGEAFPADQSEAAGQTAISLTIVLNNSGQNEEAVTVSSLAIDLATETGNELLIARAYSAAGSAANSTGNHRASIAYMQKALATAEKLQNLNGQAVVLNNLGLASRQIFDFDAAAKYFERSLALKRQQGPGARLSTTLNNLGELALVQDRFDEAEKYFLQSIDAAKSPQDDATRAGVVVNLGLVAQGRGDLEGALKSLAQGRAMADKLGDHGSVVMARLVEASVDVQLHRPAEAQSHIDESAKMVMESGDRRLAIRFREAQGDVYREAGMLDKARAEYQRAIEQYETLRLEVAGDESAQADYADNSRYLYTALISLDANSGKNDDAFRYAELSKSRVLLDDFISGRAEMTRLLTPVEAAKNTQLLARLSDLNTRLRSTRGAEQTTIALQIDKMRFDYSEFRSGVYAAHPELALRRADPEPVSIERAAALLPDEHTALISYSVGSDATYAFVIRRIGGKAVLRMHILPTDEKKLAGPVARLRSQIAGRELGFTSLARELYDSLIKPIHTDLSGTGAGAGGKVERLIISPDANLWQLPFETLEDSAGKFMAEDYEIFYAPSATVLDKMRSASDRRSGPVTMLALGDPTGDLPEAASEVTAIGKLYGAGRATVLTGAAATEAALRREAANYSIIHIAAHGKYDDTKPLYSYLALASSPATSKSPADDGNLEAREIMDLHLTAKLVVLSGCETARSSGSGVGIAGMSWAMFIAGAPATIASLWKVDSRSTALLMTNLHKGLSRGESPAKALRAAKVALMRDPAFRHPFYWAGFIGLGAGI